MIRYWHLEHGGARTIEETAAMNYLSNARDMFLMAARNLEAVESARTDFLDGISKHFSGGRRTKLKPGFNALAESFAICITQTGAVLVGNSETEPLIIEAEGCDWLTLEADISIAEDAELLVLETELFADFPQTVDVFLRVFDDDGQATDLKSEIWAIRADGLSLHTMKVPSDAKEAARCRLVMHVRQPLRQIRICQLGVYVI